MPLPSLPSPPSIFPIYLLPPLPFRRRRSSASTTSTTSASSPPSSPQTPTHYLTTRPSHLRCARCLSDLCLTSQIISKGFTGRHGRAYLVAPPPNSVPSTTKGERPNRGDLPNTHTHKPVPRQLVTGAHTVSDISCALCGNGLGWKYVAADEEGQRYKVGKFILETKRVCRGVEWEGGEDDEQGVEGGVVKEGGEEVEFDSQDEDECEDLFAGIWSPQLARRRRRGRRFGGDEEEDL